MDYEHNMTGETVTDSDGNEKSRCPICGSSNTEYVDTDYNTTSIIQSCRCNDCGTEYSEHYEYSVTYIFRDGRFQ